MARMLYESNEDRHNESAIAKRIERAWRVELKKLPMSYAVDYAVTRDNQVVGWVEVKRRNIAPSWKSIIMSVRKWRDGCILASTTGFGWAFVVENARDGKLWWFDCSDVMDEDIDLTVEWGGRTKKTRDSGDIEPVIHLPTKMFKQVDGYTGEDLLSAGFVV